MCVCERTDNVVEANILKEKEKNSNIFCFHNVSWAGAHKKRIFRGTFKLTIFSTMISPLQGLKSDKLTAFFFY